jgi:hypothetical protein
MIVDAQEHIGKVSVRIDAVFLACGHERVEDGEVLARFGVADEKEVFAAEGDDSERSLCGIMCCLEVSMDQ